MTSICEISFVGKEKGRRPFIFLPPETPFSIFPSRSGRVICKKEADSPASLSVYPLNDCYENNRLEPQQVLDGIDAAESLEREVLVVHDHPVLSLLAAKALDVGEHRDRDDNLAAVCQVSRHRALFG